VNAAAQAAPTIARRRQAQWRVVIAGACALVLVAAAVEIVLDGALDHSPQLIPKSPAIAGWMVGLGERLGYRTFLIALLSSAVAYAGVLAYARALSTRAAIALVVLLHAIVFVGPVLFSTDVFSYIAYARMGVEHGLNPYTHGPIAISHDPVYLYVGRDWKTVETAYGPLYTLLSYPLAPLGVRGALWAMKVEALLASAGTLALTWRCARARGLDARFALLALGANPLYVLYAVGGAHNDLIMMLLMMTAVSLTLATTDQRSASRSASDAAAAAAVVAGALVKATVAALLPFMLLARRSVSVLGGALVALALSAAAALLVFGVHGIDVVAALNRDAAFVSTDSFPTEIAHLFGKPGVFPVDHDLLKGAFVVIVLHLLWRTWRGYDWVAASGWTLLAISVTSTWLLAWYILWPLPLALVARDRRLLVATLAIQALFIVHQTTPLFAPVS
jgi:Glycosyltransferase family 87